MGAQDQKEGVTEPWSRDRVKDDLDGKYFIKPRSFSSGFSFPRPDCFEGGIVAVLEACGRN